MVAGKRYPWWMAGVVALALALTGCGGGGGGGTGATFVKAFGGSGMRSAAGLIPLSDGYLLVGGGVEGSGIGLATLDGNGELAATASGAYGPGESGLGIKGAEVRAVTGGWITTRVIPRFGDNAYTLQTTRYQAGATAADSPSVVWRSEEVVDFDTVRWSGKPARLAEGTRLMAMQARTVDDGAWKGVLVAVVEQAYVGSPAAELRWRLGVWRLNAGGGLQSFTVLDEGMGDPGSAEHPFGVELVVGLDGAYAAGAYFRRELLYLGLDSAYRRKSHIHRISAVDGHLWSQESKWVQRGDEPAPVLVHGDDTFTSEQGKVRRYDAAGSDQGVVVNGGIVGGACKNVGAAGYCLLISRIGRIYDLQGTLLGEVAAEQSGYFRAPVFWPDGDLRLLQSGGIGVDNRLERLYRISPGTFNTVSNVSRYEVFGTWGPDDSKLRLSEEGLVLVDYHYYGDYLGGGRSEFSISTVHDDQLRSIGSDREPFGRVSQVVPLGADRSVVLTTDGRVLRLERDRVVDVQPRSLQGSGLRIQLLPDRQGYLESRYVFAGSSWSQRNLDGTPRGSMVEQNIRALPIALPGGDVLLVGGSSNSADNSNGPDHEILRVERVTPEGAPRWKAVHTLASGRVNLDDVTYAAVLLPDGKLLVVRGRSDSWEPLRLLKVDPDTGEVLIHRSLQPASQGYRWIFGGMDESIRLLVTAEGKVWLGFTSYALVWHQLAVASEDGSRRPMPYGGKNLALIRLDDALQPDRLRVYGAGGDEELVDLHAADEGGLLVAASTTSMGLDLGDGTGLDFQNDALVLRLNADGLVEGGCQMLLKRLDDAEAAAFLGTSAPRAVTPPDRSPVESFERTSAPWAPDTPSTLPFSPVALQPARMCLAGLGQVPAAPSNSPPIANAGEDRTVPPLASVTLTGYGTDSDGAVVGYAWTQLSGPPVTLGGADTPTATFTAPAVAEAHVLTFQLTVTDDTGRTGSDVMAVTVGTPSSAPNVPPTANAGADLAATAGQTVTLAGQGSDSDGSVVAYAWQQVSGPAVSLSGAASASATFTAPTVTSAQVLSFQLTVTDDDGATGSDSVDVTVQPAPTTGSVTLTVIIDGGPGAALVRTGEQPTPQLDCRIAYETTVTCTTLYAVGTDVALYGEAFAALNMDWTGCTRGLDDLERPVCRVTMDADRTVRVHLRPLYSLQLTIDGQPNRGAAVFSSGSTATGSGANLYCVSPGTAPGTLCSIEVPEGDTLLLDWSNPTGFGVQAWSGCTPERDANNRLVCRLTMDTHREVTATFGP